MAAMQKTNSQLDHLTLRHLRLLSIWLETLSVTRTAEMFELSQPATSRIIAKLRRVLADPLVVRTPLGAAATPRALLLIPEIDATLRAVERTFAPLVFDPLDATSRIKIAATDYGATFAVAPFAAHLSTTAPRIRLETSGFTSDTFSALASGSVDMALYADA